MKKILIAMFALISTAAFAQDEKGMKFTHADSWEAIKAKAKAENKFIFVDAFTTWCGPCKMMSKDIFPLPETGDFYNAKFINVKVQMDETKEDNEEVKKWYEDAKMLAKKYDVNAYPTYLFFSPDGEIVHRAVGASPAEVFIKKGQAALDPATQYYALKKQYEGGKKDPAFLYTMVQQSQEAYDRKFFSEVMKEYMATVKDPYTKETLNMLYSSTTKTTDPGFAIFRKNGAKADSVLGMPVSKSVVKNVLLNTEVFPAMYPKDAKPDHVVNWKELETKLNKDYSDISEELIYTAKAFYFQRKKDWPSFREAVSGYVAKYGGSLTSMQLNEFAWSVFEACDDVACLEAALSWSKKSLSGDFAKEPSFMDTYANLLYKTGKKAEAIKVQEEAVALAKDNKDLAATLDKMKKGEKTW